MINVAYVFVVLAVGAIGCLCVSVCKSRREIKALTKQLSSLRKIRERLSRELSSQLLITRNVDKKNRNVIKFLVRHIEFLSDRNSKTLNMYQEELRHLSNDFWDLYTRHEELSTKHNCVLNEVEWLQRYFSQ